MPILLGPKCAACGRPRFRIAGGRRESIDCGCPRFTSGRPDGWTPGRAGGSPEPDGVHYSTMKTRTAREIPKAKGMTP